MLGVRGVVRTKPLNSRANVPERQPAAMGTPIRIRQSAIGCDAIRSVDG